MATTNMNIGLQIFSQSFIEGLRRQLAPIYAFSLNLSNDAAKVGDTIRVPLVTGAPADNFHPTTNNYAASASNLSDREVKVNTRKLSKFGIDDAQAANFLPSWWEAKAPAQINAVADACLTDLLAMITAANFGSEAGDSVTISLANFGKKGVTTIRAAAIAKKLRPGISALVLNPDYFCALLADLDMSVYGGPEAIRTGIIPNLFGFSKVIECPGMTMPGFVCHPDAICVANRWLKPIDPESYSEVGNAMDDDTGLTVGIRRFGDPAAGVESISTELCYGVEVGNDEALLRIV